MAFSFYDIDRDGIPELLLTYDTGFSDQMLICEFKNREVDLLYSSVGGGETIYYESTFNNNNIKELKMQDFINLDYFAEI